ncbi:MAG: transposase [Bacilli bacterium]
MTDDEMPKVEEPKFYYNNKTPINGFRNIIYKMCKDNISPIIIKEYVLYKGYTGTEKSLENFIIRILYNNFGIKLHKDSFIQKVLFPGLVIIKRRELLKYITTKNEKITKDKIIDKYINILKEKYPVINEIINVYNDFHNLFKNKNESLLDEFLDKYSVNKNNIDQETGEIIEIDDNIENVKSGIEGFIKSIKKDIAPIKAAISYNESSGFVEGNNNKFKLVKRILYGKSNLVNLFHKVFSIFSLNYKNDIFEMLNI